METKLILEKLGIGERGAFNILKDETLCNRILLEEPIWIVDFCKKYDISKGSLDLLINRKTISFFCNTKERTGSKVFIFEKEALEFYPLNYQTRDIYKNIDFIAKVCLEVICKTLTPRESDLLREIIWDCKAVETVAKKWGLTNIRVRQILDKAKRRVLHTSRLELFNWEKHITERQKLLFEIDQLKREKNELALSLGKDPDQPILFTKVPKHPKLLIKLIDCDLSVRALNCLKSADIETLEELISYDKTQFFKFRNFGKKSLTEIEEFLSSKGLSFGMDPKQVWINDYANKGTQNG